MAILDPNQALVDFSTENGVNAKALRNTIRGVLFFFSESIKRNISPSNVKDDLKLLGAFCCICMCLRHTGHAPNDLPGPLLQAWTKTKQASLRTNTNRILSRCQPR